MTADGIAVGAKNVGQDFTEDYFHVGAVPPRTITILTMKRTPTATARWSSTTTTVSEFAGLSSGSNNYAPSNPALTERVEADIEEFLAEESRCQPGGYPH